MTCSAIHRILLRHGLMAYHDRHSQANMKEHGEPIPDSQPAGEWVLLHSTYPQWNVGRGGKPTILLVNMKETDQTVKRKILYF
jgi:hypothetical protein